MATLLKLNHCGRFQFCTLQTVPKLAAESRLLVEANAIQRSLKTTRLDENNVVAGSWLLHLARGVNCVATMFH